MAAQTAGLIDILHGPNSSQAWLINPTFAKVDYLAPKWQYRSFPRWSQKSHFRRLSQRWSMQFQPERTHCDVFGCFLEKKAKTDHLTTFEATTLVFCVFFVQWLVNLFNYKPQVRSLRLRNLVTSWTLSPLTDRDLNFFGYKPKAQLWDLDFWLQLEPRVLWDLNFFSTVTNLTQCF